MKEMLIEFPVTRTRSSNHFELSSFFWEIGVETLRVAYLSVRVALHSLSRRGNTTRRHRVAYLCNRNNLA